MPTAISIQHISKRFGALQALDNISLTIEPGEFFALLGPNGAGKTTLISALAGLSRPDSGEITIMGHHVVRDYRKARMCLGVVPQELVFDPFLTVRETLYFQSGYFGMTRNGKWIDELLARLSLTSKAHDNMRTLSGGMKRRVMVAQALVHRPAVIVLDEPTAGVDVELRQSLWQFVRELNESGHTIVLTTHYLEEAEALCHRIAMLKNGRLVALDHKDKLLPRATTRDVALKLSAPLPDALRPLWRRDNGRYTILELPCIGQLETVLACLRQSQIEVNELSVIEADLESAFISIMSENSL